MANFELTCCSTADMPREFFEKRNIPFVCFHFNMDGKEYPDDLGLSMPIGEFYDRIAAGAQPTTSQISAGEYIDFFTPILEAGKDIVHLTLSSGISGTYNSCAAAAGILKESYPDRSIFVIDSLAASSGYGLLVDFAADLRDQGLEADKAAQKIEEVKLKVNHWVFSTDLTSYWRGGRISKTSAVVGGLLNICPIITVNKEGKLVVVGKCRGKKRAIDEMVKKMSELAENRDGYSGKCFISQSACFEDARKVADAIEAKFAPLNGKVMINDIGTVIGSHTGPGTVAVFFWGSERKE